MERRLEENIKYKKDLPDIRGHNDGEVIKLCISGAADIGHCGLDANLKAKELGREVAKQAGVLLTGATTGFPFWGAIGCKEEDGISIGISPASSEKEHLEVYRMPTQYMDLVMYTGFGFSGRNLLLTRSADAVLVGCGRIGTVNEFTIAYEDNKPIGILKGDWKMDEIIKEILDNSNRPSDKVVFDDDPKKLVRKVIKMIKEEKKKYNRVYENDDGIGGREGEMIL